MMTRNQQSNLETKRNPTFAFTTGETFKRLWVYIACYQSGLIIAVVALMAGAMVDISLMSLIKPLMDKGFTFGSVESEFLEIVPFILLGLMILRGLCNYTSTYFLAWVSNYVVMDIRREVFKHFIHMPVSYFDKQSTGTLLSHITYDSEQLADATSRALIILVRDGTIVLGSMVVMFFNSWQLSLSLIVIAPSVALVIRFVSKRFKIISRRMQQAMGFMTTVTEQMLKGHREIISFGAQEVERENFDKVSEQMRLQSLKLTSTQAFANPLIQVISSLALVAILLLLNLPSIRQSLTPGTFVLVFTLMFGLMRPLKSLTNVTSQFQRGMTAGDTLLELLKLEPEKDQGTYSTEDVKGDIEFKNVVFRYDLDNVATNNNVLTDFNFKLEAGKTLAIVGRSGAGKSTIVNLLTRFYDIQSGDILLDGKSIYSYKLENLRKHISTVSQQVHLFDDTVSNNISYSAKDKYTQEEIEKVATLANAKSFIEEMHNGFDTVIGENGVMLSGGQRQRIAIARALLRNAPVLVLDEATSALDTESEMMIQSALAELQKDRTVIVIAHRLSTVEKADYILVIDQGAIVEQGDHQSLLSKKGVYYQLHQKQFSDL